MCVTDRARRRPSLLKLHAMKAALIATTLFLFMAGYAASARVTDNMIVKKKSINKQKFLNYRDTLVIKNSFGNVNVTNWDKNVTGIEIIITSYAPTEELAKELLNNVNIVETKPEAVGGALMFRTFVKPPAGRSDGIARLSGSTDSLEFEVNITYNVRVPRNTIVDVKNNYGNIEIGEFHGKLTADVAHGAFHAKKIVGGTTTIRASQGIGVNKINYIEGGTLKGTVQGTVMIARAVNTLFEDINGCEIGYAKNITVNKTNGHMKIDTVNGIKATVSYTNMTIGCVTRNADLKLSYCNKVCLNGIGNKGVGNVKVIAHNSSVSAHLNESENTELKIITVDTKVNSARGSGKPPASAKAKASQKGLVYFDMKGGSLALD